MAMDYFLCYHSYLKKCEKLTDEEVGRLFRSLLTYSATGETPELTGREVIAFDFIADDIDREKTSGKKGAKTTAESGGEERPPQEPPKDVFISLILNDKSLYGVEKSKVEHWKGLFPAVDVEQELRNMAVWCESNPGKRKTRNGIERYIAAWLTKKQDQGRKPEPVRKRNSSYDIDELEKLSYFDLPDNF